MCEGEDGIVARACGGLPLLPASLIWSNTIFSSPSIAPILFSSNTPPSATGAVRRG